MRHSTTGGWWRHLSAFVCTCLLRRRRASPTLPLSPTAVAAAPTLLESSFHQDPLCQGTYFMAYDAHIVTRAAVELMRAAPRRPLAEVARHCGVSRDTLARAFSRCGPVSPAAVRDRLMHQRMEALMTAIPPKTIKEISDELGFATAQSFARWVKRQDGMVPGAVRAELCRRRGER